MNRKWLVLIILFSSQCAHAQIKGNIKDETGDPAHGVLVRLKKDSILAKTLSDLEGNFRFHIMDPSDGLYTILFSSSFYEKDSIEIEVKKGKPAKPIHIRTKLAALNLEALVVNSEQELNKTVNERKITTISRLPVAQKYQITNVSVIDSRMLAEQQIRSLDEAINLAPGFNLADTRGGTQVNVQVRGVEATMLYNGLRLEPNTRGGQGIFNFNLLDNVEFISGSSGIGLGNGSIGGTINLNSKQANLSTDGNAFLSYGSWNTYGGVVDKNFEIIDNKLGFRINLTGTRGRRARVFTGYHTYGITPSFYFKPSPKSIVRLDYVYSYDWRVPDQGNLIWVSGEVTPSNLPIMDFFDDFLGFKQDFQWERKHIITASFDHELNSKWTISAKVGYYDRFRDRRGISVVNAYEKHPLFKTNESFKRRIARNEQENDVFNARIDFIGKKIELLSIQNNLQLGVDTWHNFKAVNGYDEIDNAASNDNSIISTRDPGRTVDRVAILGSNMEFNNDIEDRSVFTDEQRARYYFKNINTSDQNRKTITGFTFQNQFAYKKIRATIGYRLSVGSTHRRLYQNWQTGDENVTRFDTEQFTGLTSNYGLFYDASKETVVYATYADTFDETNVSADRVDINGDIIPNEIIKQFEVGVRNTFFDKRLSLNTSFYRIINNDVAYLAEDEDGNPDTLAITGLPYYVRVGNERRLGAETFLQGKISNNLTISGSYAFFLFDPILPDTVGIIVSHGNPKHSGNLWVNYSMLKGKLKGLSVGLGGQYVGVRTVSNTNTTGADSGTTVVSFLPSYFKLDARISYEIKRLGINLKFNNLANQQTFDTFRTSFINITPPFNFEARVLYWL